MLPSNIWFKEPFWNAHDKYDIRRVVKKPWTFSEIDEANHMYVHVDGYSTPKNPTYRAQGRAGQVKNLSQAVDHYVCKFKIQASTCY